MPREDTLVPMWIARSGNHVLDRMPSRPVVIDVETLGTVLHGQVVQLSLIGARVLPDDPFLLWKNVRVTVRFRFENVIYILSGATTASNEDHSFSFDFDSVTRKRMEVLRAQLKDEGCLQASELADPGPELEEQEEEEPRSEAKSNKTKEELRQVRHMRMPPGRERRVHERHDLLADATIQKITTSRILKCQVLEISLGGCRVYTEFPHGYEKGDRVEVQFVGRGFPFRLAAAVQFEAGEQLAGLKFLHMSMRTSERLVELIHELAEKKISPLL